MNSVEELHKLGILHDAIAVIILNKNKQILLTKRSKNKLGAGLWEIPGSHIRKDEGFYISGSRCLKKELNIDIDKFEYIGKFKYFVKINNEFENEKVYVILCYYDGLIEPNPEEVEDFKWISLEELKNQMKNYNISFWLKEGFKIFYDDIKKLIS